MADSFRVSVHTFGPVFATAMIGSTLSSLVAGPLANRVGRKTSEAGVRDFLLWVLASNSAPSTSFVAVIRFLLS
jgi:MFS family permease